MRYLAVAILSLLSISSVSAQHSVADSLAEYGFHGPHHFSILQGSTYIEGEGDSFTVGLDYEYRLNKLLGVGAVVEKAYGHLDAVTALAVADIHFSHGLILQVGPGYERRNEHTVFVSRIGMLFEFEIKNFTLSPQLHWDYHDGEANAIVAGLALGVSF